MMLPTTAIIFLAGAAVAPRFGPPAGPPARIALDNEPWGAAVFADSSCTQLLEPAEFSTFTELEVWKQGDFVCEKESYPNAPDAPPSWFRAQVLCRDNGEVAIEYYQCDKENCGGSCDAYYGTVSSTAEEWAKLSRGECAAVTCEDCFGGPTLNVYITEEPGAVFGADICSTTVAPQVPAGSPRIRLDNPPFTGTIYDDAGCTVFDPVFGSFTDLEVWQQGDYVCEKETYPDSPDVPPTWYRSQVLCRDNGEVAIAFYVCDKENCGGSCDELGGIVAYTAEEWAKLSRGECAAVTCEGCFGAPDFEGWIIETTGSVYGADICSGRSTTHHQSRTRGQIAVAGAAVFFLLGLGVMARRNINRANADGDGEAPGEILASDFSTVPELESDFSTESATPAEEL